MRNEAYRGYPHISKGMQRFIGALVLISMTWLTTGCGTNTATPEPQDPRFAPVLLVQALSNGSCIRADGTFSPNDLYERYKDRDIMPMKDEIDGYAEPADLCMNGGPSCGGKSANVAFPDGMVICLEPIAP